MATLGRHLFSEKEVKHFEQAPDRSFYKDFLEEKYFDNEELVIELSIVGIAGILAEFEEWLITNMRAGLDFLIS